MKSDNVKAGVQQAPHRSLFNALGMTKEELDKEISRLEAEARKCRKVDSRK